MANRFKNMSEEDLNLILDAIEENLNLYLHNKVNIRNFSINLSNGESEYFNLHKSTIAHLLGINIDYLISTGFFYSSDKSYDILLDLLNNRARLINLVKMGKINLGILFSDHIFEKNIIFRDLFNLDLDNFLFASSLISNRYTNLNSSKDRPLLLAYKINSDEEEYRIVILSKLTLSKYRGILSHRYYDNKQDFIKDIKYFTEGQEISFITSTKCYEKKDENEVEIIRTYNDLYNNTKLIDELKLDNTVNVDKELESELKVADRTTGKYFRVYEATNNYELLKILYELKLEDSIIYKDDSLMEKILD